MLRGRKGLIWILAGVVVAVLAGVAAMLALRAAISTVQVPVAEAPLTRSVVVASRLIARRSTLTYADLEIKELPEDSIRSGAIVRTEDAVGKITLAEFNQGEMILAQNLLEVTAEGAPEGGEPSLAEALEEDELAIGLQATDVMNRFGVLQPGDKVDVLFSVNVAGKTYQEEIPRGGLVAVNALQGLEILQIVTTKTQEEGAEEETEGGAVVEERLIVLIADPQQAAILKYLKDSGGVIDFALRSPASEQLFDVEAVTINYLAERYRIVPPEPLD
ncbi:MAG: Flp pilus assembly protein CpaB [Anaerolineae bacterium]|nr:Flp pilus assembly protein CpaB [Anaerolineae bacterium]